LPGVPAFILRRLYVKGSLHNRPDGWGFQLKNSLGAGYAKELKPLTADGEAVATDQTFFRLDERDVAFSEVSDQNTFALKMNRTILIRAVADELGAGQHKIGMGFVVPGFGLLEFDFTDEAAAEPPSE